MLEQAITKLKLFDGLVGNQISFFLKPYSVEISNGYFVTNIPFFIKITFYLLVFIIPLLILKVRYTSNKFIDMIIIFLIFIITLLVFGIFCGFFQLLYSWAGFHSRLNLIPSNKYRNGDKGGRICSRHGSDKKSNSKPLDCSSAEKYKCQ